ncbi:hypothetical protein SAMN05421820_101458 [Pedobacter steynii]|uniref:Kazal-like domain-containing protein n=1 Tax=Pedobacter steynii TaxID=430522 RepID=A0A1G9K4A7_9SPHI|nr:hypothetical protein SAMN05421820_101458 [Pedobacter steynii]
MKKLFFTALVAAVAIGGAYAGHANTSKFAVPAKIQGTPGPCNTSVKCFPSATAPLCTISGVTYTGTSPDGTCSLRLALNP